MNSKESKIVDIALNYVKKTLQEKELNKTSNLSDLYKKTIIDNDAAKENNSLIDKKVIRALKENPALFRDTVLLMQLESIKNHASHCTKQLKALEINSQENPAELDKIKSAKYKLLSHMNELKNELDNLSDSASKKKTVSQLKVHTNEINYKNELGNDQKCNEPSLER